MSDKRKVSIFVLGSEDYLKKSLTSLILGKDVFVQRSIDVKTETYDNDIYEVKFPSYPSRDIKLFSSQRDRAMYLFVVGDGFNAQQVKKDVGELHTSTGKDWKVVLPLGCIPTHPFTCCTMGDLFNELSELAKERKLMLTKKRSADETHPRANRTDSDGRYSQDHLTGHKKSSKENHSDNKVNLVLLGKYGSGKSASGNTILGKRKFVSKASSEPLTTECQAAETDINGTRVCVIDTPDMFDDEIKVRNQHVKRCRQLCQPDPCVYLLVMQVGRFTDGEREILTKVKAAFDLKNEEQIILLFTHGEELQSAGMSLDDFLQDCQPELKNIVDQCGGRCVVFENRAPDQHQVTELMQTVNRVLNK